MPLLVGHHASLEVSKINSPKSFPDDLEVKMVGPLALMIGIDSVSVSVTVYRWTISGRSIWSKVFGILTQLRIIFDKVGQEMTFDYDVKCPIGCQRSRKDLSSISVSSERNSLEVQTRNWSMSDREVETSENMLTNRPCLKSIQDNIFRSSQIGGFSNTNATFGHPKIFRTPRLRTDRGTVISWCQSVHPSENEQQSLHLCLNKA